MGRVKIPMQWIPNDSSRNMTFKKRKKGLTKKVEELTILCGVEACMVCFGPQAHNQGSHFPDVWPNNSKASEAIERYRRLPKEEKEKKKLDDSHFMEQRIRKLKIELEKKREENRELEMDTMYSSLDKYLTYSSVAKLRDLLGYVDTRLENVKDRINYLTVQENEISHGGNTMVPFTDGIQSMAAFNGTL